MLKLPLGKLLKKAVKWPLLLILNALEQKVEKWQQGPKP